MPPLKPFLLALFLGAAGGAFANSFDAQYLIPGRFYYLSYEQSF